MKTLVIGAFGYLGGRLAKGLVDRGHDVVLAGRRIRESGSLGRTTAVVDVLSDVETLRAAIREHQVETIVQLAALDEIEAVRDPDLAVRVSGEGTRRVIAAAKAENLRKIIYFSTFHVYGRSFPARIDEDSPTKASHPYAVAHLAGEGFCRESNATGGPCAVVFRMSNGYGAPVDLAVERWTLAHNMFCRQAIETGKITLTSSGTQRRDFVWFDDVAQATELVMNAPEAALGEAVLGLGGGRTRTIFELATVVSERAELLTGRPVPIERPSVGEPTPDFHFSIERLTKLGYATNEKLAHETDVLLRSLQSAR